MCRTGGRSPCPWVRALHRTCQDEPDFARVAAEARWVSIALQAFGRAWSSRKTAPTLRYRGLSGPDHARGRTHDARGMVRFWRAAALSRDDRLGQMDQV